MTVRDSAAKASAERLLAVNGFAVQENGNSPDNPKVTHLRKEFP
jgi:hypothetical protein